MAWLVIESEVLRAIGPARGVRCHTKDKSADQPCSDELCGGNKHGPDGTYWGCCPWTAMKDPAWSAGMHLYNASRVNPLSGWPHEYAAFASEIVMTVDRVKAEKEYRTAKAKAAR